jgi:hypothetical protein
MTIRSYEEILARKEVFNAGAQEDKLVRWFVAAVDAVNATKPRKGKGKAPPSEAALLACESDSG